MSPWHPTVVAVPIVMYVILAEAITVCSGILLEKLGKRHSLSIRVVEMWEPVALGSHLNIMKGEVALE